MCLILRSNVDMINKYSIFTFFLRLDHDFLLKLKSFIFKSSVLLKFKSIFLLLLSLN